MVMTLPLRSFIWPRRHDDLAGFDAAQDRNLIAARAAQFDEALFDYRARLALLIGTGLFDHENRVAIRVVGNRRLRQRDLRARIAAIDAHRGVHSRHQAPVGIVKRGANLHIAAGGIDFGIDRLDDTVESSARISVDLRADGLANL